MKIGLALRAFWKSLTDATVAERLAAAMDDASNNAARALPSPDPITPSVATPAPKSPSQNAAITLLATLQREARLIDLIHEDLDQYADAQVGAAARPCLKQCRQSLDRMLGIQKLVDAPENSVIELPADASAGRYRWSGDEGSAGASAKLLHGGWIASKSQLPTWTGHAEDAVVIAAAQVQSA